MRNFVVDLHFRRYSAQKRAFRGQLFINFALRIILILIKLRIIINNRY